MFKIKVPATSANIGPGFDCLGIALSMYNTFTFSETTAGLSIQGCDSCFKNKHNLVYTAMCSVFDLLGYRPKGLNITIEADIPLSRGLGSSAACILAGVLAANELSGGLLDGASILSIASSLEGHPDNIAPALLGGMVIAVQEHDSVYYEKINLSRNLQFCAIIPEFTLSTAQARAVLPENISHKDGVFNVGRTALLVSAIANGNYKLIRHACRDRLHQNYRSPLIANYADIIAQCESLDCLGVYLSGAGPSIMAIIAEDNKYFCRQLQHFLTGLNTKWVIANLQPDRVGAVLTKYE